MSDGERYVLDANVFIQAHRMHYAFDICPGFWTALIRQYRLGRICSVDRVRNELIDEGDQLTHWVKANAPEGFFKRTADPRVIAMFGDMNRWAQAEGQFTADAKAAFAGTADAWLVAFAKVNGATVVTHEEHAPLARRSVKIPNVCIEFSVKFCSTFAMIRNVKEQFVLKTRRNRRT